MKRHPKIRKFYSSVAWRKVQAEYKTLRAGLCERCMREGKYVPGEIVHHKVHVSPLTVDDPSITLNPDNLELLCRQCHADVHPEIYNKDQRRYEIVDGRVVARETSPRA